MFGIPLTINSFLSKCCYSLTDRLVSCFTNNIKIYIKTTPTCFGVTVTPSSGIASIIALPDDGVTLTPKHVGAVLTFRRLISTIVDVPHR